MTMGLIANYSFFGVYEIPNCGHTEIFKEGRTASSFFVSIAEIVDAGV
jgi:hypothetical protein